MEGMYGLRPFMGPSLGSYEKDSHYLGAYRGSGSEPRVRKLLPSRAPLGVSSHRKTRCVHLRREFRAMVMIAEG